MILTMTVPDQLTADFFHFTAACRHRGFDAAVPVPSVDDPNIYASKAEAAAIAVTSLLNDGHFMHLQMHDFGSSLDSSHLSYPNVREANVSIVLRHPPAMFVAQQSPEVDRRATALEAFAEVAAFELKVAVRALGELPDSIRVRTQLLQQYHGM